MIKKVEYYVVGVPLVPESENVTDYTLWLRENIGESQHNFITGGAAEDISSNEQLTTWCYAGRTQGQFLFNIAKEFEKEAIYFKLKFG